MEILALIDDCPRTGPKDVGLLPDYCKVSRCIYFKGEDGIKKRCNHPHVVHCPEPLRTTRLNIVLDILEKRDSKPARNGYGGEYVRKSCTKS